MTAWTRIFFSVVRAMTNCEIRRLYRRIEKEESERDEPLDEGLIDHYVKSAQYAISECKKAETHEDRIYWLERAKRYEVRLSKIRTKLEKAKS